MACYQCPNCGYVYNEQVGCEEEGYSKLTLWEDIPEEFPCPNCFITDKLDFLQLQEEPEKTIEIVNGKAS